MSSLWRYDGDESKLYIPVILLINYIMEPNVYEEWSPVKHAASRFSVAKIYHELRRLELAQYTTQIKIHLFSPCLSRAKEYGYFCLSLEIRK